jgi:hypothetical protein
MGESNSAARSIGETVQVPIRVDDMTRVYLHYGTSTAQYCTRAGPTPKDPLDPVSPCNVAGRLTIDASSADCRLQSAAV